MRDAERLRDIELRLSVAQFAHEQVFMIWNQVDRKRQALKAEIDFLEDQRAKVLQGQLPLDFQEPSRSHDPL